MRKTGFSRYPVTEDGNPDHIVGYIYVKDLLLAQTPRQGRSARAHARHPVRARVAAGGRSAGAVSAQQHPDRDRGRRVRRHERPGHDRGRGRGAGRRHPGRARRGDARDRAARRRHARSSRARVAARRPAARGRCELDAHEQAATPSAATSSSSSAASRIPATACGSASTKPRSRTCAAGASGASRCGRTSRASARSRCRRSKRLSARDRDARLLARRRTSPGSNRSAKRATQLGSSPCRRRCCHSAITTMSSANATGISSSCSPARQLAREAFEVARRRRAARTACARRLARGSSASPSTSTKRAVQRSREQRAALGRVAGEQRAAWSRRSASPRRRSRRSPTRCSARARGRPRRRAAARARPMGRCPQRACRRAPRRSAAARCGRSSAAYASAKPCAAEGFSTAAASSALKGSADPAFGLGQRWSPCPLGARHRAAYTPLPSTTMKTKIEPDSILEYHRARATRRGTSFVGAAHDVDNARRRIHSCSTNAFVRGIVQPHARAARARVRRRRTWSPSASRAARSARSASILRAACSSSRSRTTACAAPCSTACARMAYLPRRAYARLKAAEAVDLEGEAASAQAPLQRGAQPDAESALRAIDGVLGRVAAAYCTAASAEDGVADNPEHSAARARAPRRACGARSTTCPSRSASLAGPLHRGPQLRRTRARSSACRSPGRAACTRARSAACANVLGKD